MTIQKIVIKTLLFTVIILPLSCLFFSIAGSIVYSLGAFDEIIKVTKDQLDQNKETLKAVKDSISRDSVRLSIEKIKDTIQVIKPH